MMTLQGIMGYFGVESKLYCVNPGVKIEDSFAWKTSIWSLIKIVYT